MKAIIKNLGLGLALVLAANISFAQDTHTDNHTIGLTIPAVALLDIEPAASKNISMSFSATGLEAGEPITSSVANSSLWLNVTSIVPASITRKVTASVSDNVPTGTTLKVTAASYAGSGEGTFGTPGSQISLATTAASLITGIGSCYTGNGASNGYNLTYVWERNSGSFASLLNATTSVTVTYTLVQVD